MRSYFDVLNELQNDKDRLTFLLSIINKQFLNEDPKDLGFLTNLCYESQRHSIESSVKGWIRAAKTDLQGNNINTPPTNPRTTPPTNPKQEEGQEKGQEKGKEEKENDFKKSLLTFQDKYDVKLLEAFYLYWSESNPNGKKMKFEMQKTFDISRRLITWKKNEKNFSGAKSSGKMTVSDRQQANREIMHKLLNK